MTLKAYRQKRNFKQTPEPAGKIKSSAVALPKFVIQKHHASRLHYDLRLEAEGVLKSWAVPKGPSQNPKDKRLAMMVEDHPIDYFDFEGIIPKGNYGAGTVMVWDWGNYVLKDESDPKKVQKAVVDGINKGKLHVIFNGNKIKGEFALVKTNKEDAWLLFKIKDEFRDENSYDDEDISVKTGRTFTNIKETAENKNEVWLSPKSFTDIDFNGAKKVSMPRMVAPMLATLKNEAFDNRDWIFEIKWDGYRCIAEVSDKQVELYSRNFKSFNQKFKPIVNSLEKLPFKAIFDGEVVIVDEQGKSDFHLLQNYQSSGEGNLIYYVFDLLYLDKYDLTSLPLVKRKEILEDILPSVTNIRYSDHIPETGTTFFDMAVNMDLEGIIGKQKESKYYPGIRSNNWVKIKSQKRTEAVICGYTKPRGGRKYFGALILGTFINKQLKYIGHTGGGFTNAGLKTLYEQLKRMETEKSPFKIIPATNMPVKWVRPELVCEIKFQEWTKDGVLRMPIFLGLREDKSSKDLNNEEQDKLRAATSAKKTVIKKQAKNTVTVFDDLHEIINSGKNEATLIINNKKLKLTNINKIYWPELKYTKGDLLKYYWEIADYILPHLNGRPESLHRYPDGIYGESFYQKDMKELTPDWLETIKVKSGNENKSINYMLCQNKAALIYMANLGCIELNPWSSRIKHLDYPDYTIIDLDPPENISFEHVVEVALVVKQILDDGKINAFVKTSGSSGMHILIPLNAKYNYEQGRTFALLIGNLVHQKIKNLTTLERSTKKRGKKIYIDCLQNYAGQTIASAYCARPRSNATVSAPLLWKELDKKLSPSDFTIKNMHKRLEKKGDILKDLYKKSNDISIALRKLESLI